METLITEQYPNGLWKWTLTGILGDSLSKAEARFGRRDTNYTILGIEFVNQPRPCIWYPSIEENHIVIRLTANCINDFNQGVFQITHEVIHCLSPVRGNTTVLEEGLASYFSQEYSKNYGGLVNPEGPYSEARNLVSQLLEIDSDIIRSLRQIQPKIGLISEADILMVNPHVPKELAGCLARPF